MVFPPHLSVIAHHLLWCHIVVEIFQLVMLMVNNAVLLLEMVEVVLVLGPPNVPPRIFFWIDDGDFVSYQSILSSISLQLRGKAALTPPCKVNTFAGMTAVVVAAVLGHWL